MVMPVLYSFEPVIAASKQLHYRGCPESVLVFYIGGLSDRDLSGWGNARPYAGGGGGQAAGA